MLYVVCGVMDNITGVCDHDKNSWRCPITDLPVTLAEAKGRLCEKVPQLACPTPTVVPAMYLMSGVNPVE